jgi:hypothetical protein
LQRKQVFGTVLSEHQAKVATTELGAKVCKNQNNHMIYFLLMKNCILIQTARATVQSTSCCCYEYSYAANVTIKHVEYSNTNWLEGRNESEWHESSSEHWRNGKSAPPSVWCEAWQSANYAKTTASRFASCQTGKIKLIFKKNYDNS